MAIDVQTVQAQLEGIREGLVADGYDLKVEQVVEGSPRVRIVAGPEACEECLVPKDMMAMMLQASLTDLPGFEHIELLYPDD